MLWKSCHLYLIILVMIYLLGTLLRTENNSQITSRLIRIYLRTSGRWLFCLSGSIGMRSTRTELANWFSVTSFASILEHRHPSVAVFGVTVSTKQKSWMNKYRPSKKTNELHTAIVYGDRWSFCPLSLTRMLVISLWIPWLLTFPIARCVESIEDFGVSNGPIFFITLDSRQKYHHILLRFQDRKKLAFFTPDRKNKTFRVMTFGPKNAPAFYTAMMKNSRKSGMQILIAQL